MPHTSNNLTRSISNYSKTKKSISPVCFPTISAKVKLNPKRKNFLILPVLAIMLYKTNLKSVKIPNQPTYQSIMQ